jgi:hypothetical protein
MDSRLRGNDNGEKRRTPLVTPTKVGAHGLGSLLPSRPAVPWIPPFAGMTKVEGHLRPDNP